MKLGTRLWALITVVLGIGVLAAGWFLGASPLLEAKAQADLQRESAESQNDTIRAAIAVLKTQKDDIASYESRNAELAKAMPSDIDSAAFIRSLNAMSEATGVTITAISLSNVVPYSAPSGEAADPAAPAPVTDGRITGDNFLLVPVQITAQGGWGQLLDFTHAVQNSERLVLVNAINTSTSDETSTTTISGAMYVLIRPGASAPVAADEKSDTDSAAAG